MQIFKRTLSLLLVFVMVLGMIPVSARAAAEGDLATQVYVSVENNTCTTIVNAEGETVNAPFTGKLIEQWVTLSEVTSDLDNDGKTDMMDLLHYVLEKKGYVADSEDGTTYIGTTDTGLYLYRINGLSEKSQGGASGDASGWMGSLNDWFTSSGFADWDVAAGDEIRIQYTVNGGEDVGGEKIEPTPNTLSALTFSVGELSPAFNSTDKAYTLTVPPGTESVLYTGTATTKQNRVATKVDSGSYSYQRLVPITVSDGSVISVRVGGALTNTTYTVTVDVEEPPVTAYSVSTAQELIDAVTAANAVTTDKVTITLTDNITLPSDWTPLNVGATDQSGSVNIVIDGNGKTVTLAGTALFDGVYSPCVVKNLTVEGTATGNSGYNFGPIAISLSGTMENCISYADVTSTSTWSNAGGVVGAIYAPGMVKNCAYLGDTITGVYSAGAIASGGQNSGATIGNCWWTIDMDKADGNGNSGATVTNSGKAETAEEALARIAGTYVEPEEPAVAAYNVTTDAELIAAVEKANAGTGVTITLTADIAATGNLNFGAGINATLDGQGHTVTLNGNPLFSTLYSGSTVKNLKVEGSVSSSANNHTGAIAEKLSGTISNCVSYAPVAHTGYYNAGGLAGNLYSPGVIENSAALGAAPTGSSYGTNGAVCAYGSSGTSIIGCYWTADLTAADGANAATVTGGGKASSENAALIAINAANASDSTLVQWPATAEPEPTDPADPATVYVTIANAGALVVTQEAITVTDRNSDGKLNIDEALYAAHEAYYEGGAAAGYANNGGTGDSLFIKTLWGVTTSGTGYYVNNVSAWSLNDEVKEGDYLAAFVYKNSDWSDKYAYFNQNSAAVNAGSELELTLTGSGYYASYELATAPLSDAVITINGEASGFTTDSDGKVKVTFAEAGTYTLSATSTTDTLVPPVCEVTVTEAAAEAPKLTGVKFEQNGLALAEGEVFAEDKYSYAVDFKYTGNNPFGKITATFDAEKYTAEFVYNGGTAATLTSGTSAWVMDIPYGTTVLTVTVKDKNDAGVSTSYTFNITRPRATADTLDESYGGIMLKTPAQKLYQANADGTPIADTEGQVKNDHGYYYTKLPDGTTRFALTLELSATTVHSRYSSDNGTTWTENAMGLSVNTNEIATFSTGMTKVIVQLLSDAAYYEGTEGFDGKTSKEFVIWVEAEVSEDVGNTLSGSGTQSDPYLLGTAADFDLLDDMVEAGESFSGKYFKVTADVTMSEGWDGIGKAVMAYGKPGYATSDVWYATSMNPFVGTFDGNGHTLTFNGMPLFDCVRTATIKNLKIKGSINDDGLIANYAYLDGNSSITANISGVTVLSGTTIAGSGLLGGYASGDNKVTITDCHIQSGVTIGTAGASNIGGIAGDFNGTISNSTCAATIYGTDFVGGIVAGQGQSMAGTAITNCTFSGTIIATGNYVGGISGAGYTGTAFGIASAPNADCIDIKNCTVTGSITGGDYVGGILGAEPGVMQCWENATGTISGNTFTGTLNCSGSKVGGIIGYLESLNMFNYISGNTYSDAERGIGDVKYLDTSYANPTELASTIAFTSTEDTGLFGISKTNHYRSDDPLGADAEDLCRKIDGKDEAVTAVENLIRAIGTVTLDSKNAIDAARAAYNALDADKQAQVTNYSVLVGAENAYGDLALADMILQPSTSGDAISSFTVSHGDSEHIMKYEPNEDKFVASNAAIPNSTATTNMNFTIAKDTVLNFTPSFSGSGSDSFKVILTKTADVNAPMPLALAIDEAPETVGQEMVLYDSADGTSVNTVEIPAGSYNMSMTYTQDGTVSERDGASISGLTLTKVPDEALIAEAEAAINAIGEVTASSGTAIKTARDLYDSLTTEEKTQVTNYEILTAAEAAYAEIQANFTGYRVAVSEEKTVEVDGEAQVKLTVSHNTETQYNAYRFVVTYDPEIVTYASFSGTGDENVKITDEDGTLTIIGYGSAKTFTSVPTITFKGKANGDSQILLTEAGIDNSARAIEHNTAVALIENAETYIHVGGYTVELSGDLIGDGIVEPNGDYKFSVTDPNYTYTIKAYMMTPDGEVEVDVIPNSDGTYTIRNVTGKLRIVSSRTPKTFGITVDGTAKDDVTLSDGAPTYLTDYEFSVTKQEGYDYEALTVTIGGAAYQAAQYETDKYRIAGTDVTGNIVITLNKTKQEEGGGDTPSTTTTITFVGEGSADVEGGTTQTATNSVDFTFSISEEAGYIYTVKIGENVLTPDETGTYTIPGDQITGTAITVTVDKAAEVARTVEVNEYVKLDGKSIFLVTANGDVHEGNILTYDTHEMYWSETYNAYAYLVVSDKSLTEVTTEAEAAIGEANADKLTISYTGDINNTNQIDVNDAQLVYDMYNALYGDFTQVSIEKFLRADMNGSKSLTVEDSAAIVALVN